MLRICVLFCVASCAFAAMAMYPAKVGEKVELSLGGNIKTWIRTRDGQTEKEYIKHCGPTEKNIRCAQFVTESGKVLEPKTSAHVKADGTLVIEKIAKSDAGRYNSDDELERINKNADGSFSGTPRSVIDVIVN